MAFYYFLNSQKHHLTLSIFQCANNQQSPKNRICGGGETKQKLKKKRNISSHPTYVRRVTFRSQGSKALRAYNQYYIFHCHLHSYCKWLVSKIITGCIRNLGFAILPLVLGGPVSLPPLLQHHWVLMTPWWQTLLTPRLTFFPLCPFFMS